VCAKSIIASRRCSFFAARGQIKEKDRPAANQSAKDQTPMMQISARRRLSRFSRVFLNICDEWLGF